MEEIKSAPYVPLSHPFVERLIGTIRRKFLDRMFFWNAVDLTRKLGEFRDYYNAHRVHHALRLHASAARRRTLLRSCFA
jgi:putative transposase